MTKHAETLSFNVREVISALETSQPQRWHALRIPSGTEVQYKVKGYPGRIDVEMEWETPS